MDCISSKLEINYRLDRTKEIERELISSKNYKLLADIEGELQIYINRELFFSDDYILILEFGISLIKWLENIDRNNIIDYSYSTMDYNDGPILELIFNSLGLVSIRSEWQKFRCDEQFNFKEIRKAIEKFLESFKKDLQSEYEINITDFVK
ncbi:MAG: hypothetical protein M0Z31_14605 [Clostridia bacterium]|nr:hypothetical protein [Clostridia bacterium]